MGKIESMRQKAQREYEIKDLEQIALKEEWNNRLADIQARNEESQLEREWNYRLSLLKPAKPKKTKKARIRKEGFNQFHHVVGTQADMIDGLLLQGMTLSQMVNHIKAHFGHTDKGAKRRVESHINHMAGRGLIKKDGLIYKTV